MQLTERGFHNFFLGLWLLLSFVFGGAILAGSFSGFATQQSFGLKVLSVVFLVVVASFLALMVSFTIGMPLRITMNLAIRERRKSHLVETLTLIALLGFVLAFFLVLPGKHSEEWRRLNPHGATRLAEFAQVMPPPDKVDIIRTAQGQFVICWGDYARDGSLPSGPAAYAFDRQGKFLNWQMSTGDGGPVDELWRSKTDSRTMTLDQALQFVRQDEFSAEPSPAKK